MNNEIVPFYLKGPVQTFLLFVFKDKNIWYSQVSDIRFNNQ